VLLGPVVGAAFTPWLGLVLALFVLLAAWEWALLAGVKSPLVRALYLVALALLGIASVFALRHHPHTVVTIIDLAAMWWVAALFDLILCGPAASGAFRSVSGRLTVGALVLLPAWLSSLYLQWADPRRPALILFVFALVWVADSSAYFVGRAWGRMKLASGISPGKTVEGLLGAAAAVVVLSYFYGTMVWQLSDKVLLLWMAVAIVTLLFSVVGDLVESKLKRLAGVKDSGSWLPGHGGVLDRIDALTAAAPVFTVGWTLLLRMHT
jgi:phosphatidate cytidylyltransferase